jgi:hypothetical protein
MCTLNNELNETENFIPNDIEGPKDSEDLGIYRRAEYRREEDFGIESQTIRILNMNDDEAHNNSENLMDQTTKVIMFLIVILIKN